MSSRPRFWSRLALSVVLLGASVLATLFPGARLRYAITLATGLGVSAMQARIDRIEGRAVAGAPLEPGDREFLVDFYRTLAMGARLSWFVRQTGGLMDHYLDGSGADYRLDPVIFRDNVRVQGELERLRRRVVASGCSPARVTSPVFYMPHASQIDSVFGLYHGAVSVTAERREGDCVLHVRAEVPWQWPSFASLKRRYGTAHAESFPLPNARSLLFGERYAVRVDNGLGEYLVGAGLARPFLAYAEWDERFDR